MKTYQLLFQSHFSPKKQTETRTRLVGGERLRCEDRAGGRRHGALQSRSPVQHTSHSATGSPLGEKKKKVMLHNNKSEQKDQGKRFKSPKSQQKWLKPTNHEAIGALF